MLEFINCFKGAFEAEVKKQDGNKSNNDWEKVLPSRSFSGVSAVYQLEGGPVPLTVMADTWKLYWLPFSSPIKEFSTERKKIAE